MKKYNAWIKITNKSLYVEEFDYNFGHIALATSGDDALMLDSKEVSKLREFVARAFGAGIDVHLTEGD